VRTRVCNPFKKRVDGATAEGARKRPQAGGRKELARRVLAVEEDGEGSPMYMVVGFEVMACSIERKASGTLKDIACPSGPDDPVPTPQEIFKGMAQTGKSWAPPPFFSPFPALPRSPGERGGQHPGMCELAPVAPVAFFYCFPQLLSPRFRGSTVGGFLTCGRDPWCPEGALWTTF
jgi:hypothetical protein